MMSRAIACRRSFPLLRNGRQCWMTGARNYATNNNNSSGRSSFTRKLVLFGVSAAVGADIALVIKSRNDSDFKQWMDGYIPGWAVTVDEIDYYSKSLAEWVSQQRKDFFHSGEESEKSLMSTKPLPALDKSKHDLEPETKEGPSESKPLKNTGSNPTDKSKQDLEPVSKATNDIKKSSVAQEGSDKQAVDVTVPEKVTQEPTVEQKRTIEPEKPQDVEKSVVDVKEDGDFSTAKDTEKEQEPVQENIEPRFVKCLEEFTEAGRTVAASIVMLSKAMEKARGDIALLLLQPSPDYEKLAELEKTVAETTPSLKEKVDKSYCNYCDTFQALQGIVNEAYGDAGLDSLVSKAQQTIFKQAVLVQSAEETVRINEAIDGAFNSFINTVKSTESELAKELAELDAPADVKAGLEEAAVLLLAERRIKLLYDKLKQLSPGEVAKSLEKQKIELSKLYEEKMQKAMDESRADMQQRTEAKLEEVRRKYDIELLEQLRRQAVTHNQHLKDSLEQREAELNEKWTEELQKKMAAQAEQYRLEMIAMHGKLAGIESTIDSVAKSSQEVRLRQSLHTASDNLFKALVTANQSVEAEKRYTFNKEIADVKEVAGHDEMINQLLLSIPEEAVKQGIYSEEVLKERFYRVKRVCSRVSLVPLEGAGLGMYMLSYFRSLLMLTVRNVPIDSDSSQLDTFQLLQLANTHLSAGDLEMAVRVMNQLQGEAGRVAKDWITDVRTYLQTKQAITTLADYMSAAGLSLLK